MSEFFTQTPPDLRPLLREIIAIPWHREPAYRKISVQSVIKAAGVEDRFAKDIKRLCEARSEVHNLQRSKSMSHTATKVMSRQSLGMRVVFVMGGFARFPTPWVDVLYAAVFNLSFWYCGALCAANLYYRSVPFHVYATDALTAYVHFPAWQGWRRWRSFVQSEHAQELLAHTMRQQKKRKNPLFR